MFTIVNRRKMNRDTADQTMERARQEFFPKLQAAQGFTGFYLIADEERGENVAVVVFESAEAAQAFLPQGQEWAQVLEEMGHQNLSDNAGQTVVNLEGGRS